MIQRLRQLHQTEHLVLSTISIGTMLLLAYLTDTTSARLWTALAFLASGAGVLVASRVDARFATCGLYHEYAWQRSWDDCPT